MNRHRRVVPPGAAVFACLLSPGEAHAYVDPGSAGFVVTAVLGFLAAFGYTVRAYLHRLKLWVFRVGRKDREGGISAAARSPDP